MADSNTGTRIAPPDAVPDDGDPASPRRAKTRPTVIADNRQSASANATLRAKIDLPHLPHCVLRSVAPARLN
jgi:hypothetical protein